MVYFILFNSKPQSQMCDWNQKCFDLFCKNLKSRFSTLLLHLTLRFLYILGCSGPGCGTSERLGMITFILSYTDIFSSHILDKRWVKLIVKVRMTLKSQFGSSLQWMRITKRIQNSSEFYLLGNDDFKKSYIRPFAVHLHLSSIDFTAHYPYLQSCSSNTLVTSICFYPNFI